VVLAARHQHEEKEQEREQHYGREIVISEAGHKPAYAIGRASQRVSIGQGRDGAILIETMQIG
jgi:hypothetical protein